MASIRDLLKQIGGFGGGNLQGQLDRRPAGLDPSTGAIWEAPREWDVNEGLRGGAALGSAALHDAGSVARDVPAPVETRGGFDSPLVAPTATRERRVNTPPPVPIRNLLDGMAAAPMTTNAAPTSDPTMRDMQRIPYEGLQADPNNPVGRDGQPLSPMRDRRTKMRDYVADDAQYLRDREAQPMGKLDKVLGIIGGLNANMRGERGELTGRDRELGRANRALVRDMAVQKQQTATEAREAAILAGQERIRQGDERIAQGDKRLVNQGETLTARKERWKQMGQHERVQDALRVYNSGGANDPETLAAISDTLGLPADLKPKFNAGEIVPKVDDNGKIQLINKRDGSVVDTGVKDYETIKEAGRNTRQERAANASMERTKALIAAGIGKLGDPAVTESTAADLEDQAQDAEELAAELTEKGFPSQGAKALDRAVKLRDSITSLKEAANKARTAGAVGAPKVGRTIEGAVKAFTKKNNRAPTAEETAKMKAKLDAG